MQSDNLKDCAHANEVLLVLVVGQVLALACSYPHQKMLFFILLVPEGPVLVSVSQLDLATIFPDFFNFWSEVLREAGRWLARREQFPLWSFIASNVGGFLPVHFDVIKKLSCGSNPPLEERRGESSCARCGGRRSVCPEPQLKALDGGAHPHPAPSPRLCSAIAGSSCPPWYSRWKRRPRYTF